MSRLLFILSGSIADYKACEAISQLVQRGHAVRTVATAAALKFVGAATLEGLTRAPVATDIFAAGGALEHIDLVRWADAVVVCPASANTLNRAAAGIADDLAGALLLARRPEQPLIVAPAMNPAMWAHPATQAAVARLRSWGARMVGPGEGRTACGEMGSGRMAEPAEVVAAVESALQPRGTRRRVLVTSGGTAEPIDGVRFLTNASSGETGALIADTLAAAGNEVVLLRAETARRPAGCVREETFRSFLDLDAALGRLLGEEEFDAVIHAAAVSDFSVAAVEVNGAPVSSTGGKLSSKAAPTIRLKTNPKLLETLRKRSRKPGLCVIGFKLTHGAGAAEAKAAVARQFETGAVDYVVHNDAETRGAGGVFPATLWARGGESVSCSTREALAAAVGRAVELATDAPAGRLSPDHAPLPRHR